MPILDLGYRRRDSAEVLSSGGSWFNWVPITTHGIRLVYRGTWLRRTLVLTLLPAVLCAAIIFALEQMPDGPRERFIRTQLMVAAGASDQLPPVEMLRPGDEDATAPYDRELAWRTLLANFFRYPQSFVMLLLVGLIAPRLIAFDYRSRGYLLYFSRPIGVGGYLMGKQCIVWFFLSSVTTLTALLVYILGLAVSPDLSVFWDTWDLPPRILAASFVLIVPTTLVALLMSSMTVESRYAAFGWFAFWTLGWVTYQTLRLASLQIGGSSASPMETIGSPWFTLFSPYHTLGRIQYWIYGVTPMDRYTAVSIVVVSVVALVCYAGLHLRISRRLKS